MVTGMESQQEEGGALRPEFHFTVERGWINDPHGITCRDGDYHLFYQYVPDSIQWAPNCHWGHAVGPDLFSLSPRPVALAPGGGDDGIWSGSLAMDESGQGHIFYTSVTVPDFGVGAVRAATPTDGDWIGWRKGDRVVEPPESLDVVAFRDPFVFRDGATWRMLVGAALAGGTAAALSYSSSDLTTWVYDGIAAQRSTIEADPVWMGSLWECPQLFELDGKHVLVTSVWENDVLHYAAYGIGSYSNGRFTAESWGRLTYGPSLYAPSFFRDASGEPSLLFWIRGVRGQRQGWASCHSIPYSLSIEAGRLVTRPHADIEKYRLNENASSRATGTLVADITWRAEDAGVLAIYSGGQELLRVSRRAGHIDIASSGQTCTLPLLPGDTRIIFDRAVVEVCTPGGLAAFPVRPDGDRLELQATSGVLSVADLARDASND